MADEYPMFILTTRGDDVRRAPLTDWLDAHGIAYELFLGVDGRNGLAPQWETSINRPHAAARLGRSMGDGEFACALSHQEIYRHVLERALPGAVVLEDDAVPHEVFSEFLATRGYLRAPIVLLDHSNTRAHRRAPIDLGRGVVGHRVALPPFRTTAYTISADAAAKMRKASFPIAFTADWPCDIARLEAVAAMPRPVGHPEESSEQSHIHHERGRQSRKGRFLTADYWRRWWRKRRSVRLPDAAGHR